MAISGLFGVVLRGPALPLKADVAAVGRESPKLNIPLEFGRGNLKKVSCFLVRDRSSRDALE